MTAREIEHGPLSCIARPIRGSYFAREFDPASRSMPAAAMDRRAARAHRSSEGGGSERRQRGIR